MRQPRLRIARARAQDGFTLVEVLVSLGLLALVMALLTGGIRFAQNTWVAAARLDAQASAGTAEGFLRARLGEAMPLYEQAGSGLVRVAFTGTEESFSFVAPAANGPLGAGLYHHVVEVAAGSALRVKLVPYQAKESQSQITGIEEQHILMSNVRALTLRYFGPGAPRAQPAWHAAWKRADALPQLVEFTIARSDGADAHQVVVELRLRPAQR